jgi:hypothetical protein
MNELELTKMGKVKESRVKVYRGDAKIETPNCEHRLERVRPHVDYV